MRSALWLGVRLLALAALTHNWGGITEAVMGQVHYLSEAVITSYVSSITEQMQSIPRS